MSWLAAVIKRVSNVSSLAGKAFWPVWSHDLTSARVVRSPTATRSAFRSRIGGMRCAFPPYNCRRAEKRQRLPPCALLPVGNVADDTHCEGRVDRQHFLGIDADLALTG